MRVPVELLVLACVVVGTLPALSIGPALATAARPVVGGTLPDYSLSLWHGFNAPLLMSLVALAVGLLVYWRWADAFKRRLGVHVPLLFADGKRLFERLLAGVTAAAWRGRRVAGTRRLQPQLMCMVAIAAAAGLGSALIVPLEWGHRPRVPATPEFALLWVLGGSSAVGAAVLARFHRLAALALLGVVGVALCISFAWFSAPDLALTQLAVEVVTLVLFLLGLRWLPRRVPLGDTRLLRTARRRRRRDLALALLVGAGLATLSYALLTRTAPLSIAPGFLLRALPEGGGTNVVNVMLVDFRAFDTLGEVTVLAVVGLTVFGLLRRFRPPGEVQHRPPQQQAASRRRHSDLAHLATPGEAAQHYLEVPAVLVRLLLPVALMFAAHLFLRGHNQPGGGFVAGLVVAIAVIAQYMVGGTRWVEDRLRLRPPRWIATGLLLALLTGLGSLALGYPFLTTHTAHFTLPLLGEVHLPSATFFDLGVFAVVVGSTLLLLTAIAHQSLRARRRPGDNEAGGATVMQES